MEISDLAIFKFLDNQETSSEFALPFSGTLMTLSLRYSLLSGVVNVPQTLQQEELGLSLTLNNIPLSVISKNNLARNQ